MQSESSIRILFVSILILCLITTAAAEDKLKPVLDKVTGAITSIAGKLAGILFSLFPTFEDSLKETMDFMDSKFPAMRNSHWAFYLAVLLVVVVILSKLWDVSRDYIVNSVIGFALLLILIHVLGVEIKVTLITLLMVTLIGVPGVLAVLIMHYLGIVM